MRKLLCMAVAFAAFNSFAQAPEIQWSKAFGGTGNEEAYSIIQTADGGFVFAGETSSADNDVSENNGAKDLWVVKLNAQGAIQWENTYGADLYDGGSVQATADGGFIIGGYSEGLGPDMFILKLSAAGDQEWEAAIGGTNGSTLKKILTLSDGYLVLGDTYIMDETTSNLYWNIYAAKLNTAGEIVWEQTYGELGENEDFEDATATDDGHFAILGSKLNQDNYDAWLFKINGNGVVQWEQTYGGSTNENPSGIEVASDGGYVFSAQSSSYGNISDIIVYKTSDNGQLQWHAVTGGSGVEYGVVKQTSDGGYIVSGYTYSDDGDAVGTLGVTDLLVVKLNADGTKAWSNIYGGEGDEYFGYSYQFNQPYHLKVANILETNNGYVISALTHNTGNGSLPGSHGEEDSWLIKINHSGDLLWDVPFGGSNDDVAAQVIKTEDGGYATIGFTLSADGDVSNYHGLTDVWVTKFGPETLSSSDFTATGFSVYPNPVSTVLNVVLPDNNAPQTVCVTDITGKKVMHENGQNLINVEKLEAGIYFIEVASEGKTYKAKLIKK